MNTLRSAVVLAGLALPALLVAQEIKPRAPDDDPARAAPAEAEQSASGPARAQQLFYHSDASGEGKKMGLRIKLYRREPDCDIVTVPAHHEFVAGDRVRFGVETNRTGYLYIVQRGSSGGTTLLFPHPQIDGGENRMNRGRELVIPGTDWFAFDTTPGSEELQFILARKKLDILRQLAPPTGAGATPPAPPAGSLEGSVLQALQRGSRDLVLSTGDAQSEQIQTSAGSIQASTYAVNAGSDGADYCVLRLRLRHR